jgi:hypothetical protein
MDLSFWIGLGVGFIAGMVFLLAAWAILIGRR